VTSTGRNRRIVLLGNRTLRKRARAVAGLDDDVRRLLSDLKVTMQAQDGLGLAANQVGELVRAFAIDPRGADLDAAPYCVVNPEIVVTEGEVEREEGCLSVPGIYEVLPRPELVRIRGLDEKGNPVELEATGLLARAYMHEIDHLNGRLLIDRIGDLRLRMLADRLREIEERERQECA
jgi:peptide deformylase